MAAAQATRGGRAQAQRAVTRRPCRDVRYSCLECAVWRRAAGAWAERPAGGTPALSWRVLSFVQFSRLRGFAERGRLLDVEELRCGGKGAHDACGVVPGGTEPYAHSRGGWEEEG